ncbi:MAG: selenocysteine-specific translation elongation factor [Kiritimatiellae bacterium]|nr:selenocysteine-specific translation elongation factor [Kiritimatiellia bacterium]
MKTAPESEVSDTQAPGLRGISLTLGTAGHIDHGKTAIVKCLTGCDCDRLPEERARGMTIDLGFAVWQMGDGRRVGIVDVPGHERFIHNMVAGASGIDVVMLVVAADDGVMPQTVEHAQIVGMLGIRRGLVVINKIDLADEARRRDVEEQVRALVAGTFLKDCPMVRFSARTGEGFDDLHAALSATVSGTAERVAEGPFCLHVERSFVLQGLGTIVSGVPRSGKVRVGDELEILPGRSRHTVKGLQVFGQDAALGRAGECAALRLSGVTRAAIARGMVLATPGYFEPSRFVNARFHYLPTHDRPLEPRTAVRFHVGTSETPGHLVLPELSRLAPGSETYAQIQLTRPAVAAAGDFFVVRQLSPARTLGGGHVVDSGDIKLRRGRGQWVEVRAERDAASGDAERAMLLALDSAAAVPWHVDEWCRKACVAVDAGRAIAARLSERGAAVALPGERYAAARALAETLSAVCARCEALHAARPLELGFEKKEILRSLSGNHLLIDRAFEVLLADGGMKQAGSRYCLSGREPRLSGPDQRLAEQIGEIYRKGGFATPRPDELPAATGAAPAAIGPIVTYLVQSGVLVELADKLLMHAEYVELSREALETYFRKSARLRSGDFKELLGTSRKFAIPLLEYWDRMGLTRRIGDERELKTPEAG